jgi:hypothetical protein
VKKYTKQELQAIRRSAMLLALLRGWNPGPDQP